MNEQLSIIMGTFERSVEHCSVVAEQKFVDALKAAGLMQEALPYVFEVMEKNPKFSWGRPGYVSDLLEQYRGNGYEELLEASIERNPTQQTVWLLYRDAKKGPEEWRDKLVALLKEVGERDDIDMSLKFKAQDYVDMI